MSGAARRRIKIGKAIGGAFGAILPARRPANFDQAARELILKLLFCLVVDAVRSKRVSGGVFPVIAKITGNFEITGKPLPQKSDF